MAGPRLLRSTAAIVPEKPAFCLNIGGPLDHGRSINPVETEKGIARAGLPGLLGGSILGQHDIFEDEDIHVGGEEATVRVFRGADDWLAADIKTCVYKNGAASQAVEKPQASEQIADCARSSTV